MDPKTRLFVWMLCAGAGMALVGGLFGALTGAWSWSAGRPAGTWLGLRVARAFQPSSREELSPGWHGALVGASDGLVFGGAIGTVFGFLIGQGGTGEWEVLAPALLAVAVLAGAALFLGVLAALLVRVGTRAVLGLFVGGMLGSLLGHTWGATEGLYLGLVLGALCGTLMACVLR